VLRSQPRIRLGVVRDEQRHAEQVGCPALAQSLTSLCGSMPSFAATRWREG
jgi:hypothetical protein